MRRPDWNVPDLLLRAATAGSGPPQPMNGFAAADGLPVRAAATAVTERCVMLDEKAHATEAALTAVRGAKVAEFELDLGMAVVKGTMTTQARLSV